MKYNKILPGSRTAHLCWLCSAAEVICLRDRQMRDPCQCACWGTARRRNTFSGSHCKSLLAGALLQHKVCGLCRNKKTQLGWLVGSVCGHTY